MNTHSFFSRLCHSQIPRRAAVTLVALAWSSLTFGGEIHDAARSGDLAKVQALLKDKPDLVFSKDDNGATALHVAAQSGHKEIVELLLASHADVNPVDNNGWTPLHAAVLNDRKDMVELLLTNHADINAARPASAPGLPTGVPMTMADFLLATNGGRSGRWGYTFAPCLTKRLQALGGIAAGQ